MTMKFCTHSGNLCTTRLEEGEGEGEGEGGEGERGRERGGERGGEGEMEGSRNIIVASKSRGDQWGYNLFSQWVTL